jgi:hypothetical protein
LTRFLFAAAAALLLSPLTPASDPPVALLPEPPAAWVQTADAPASMRDVVLQVDVGRFGGSGVCVAEHDGVSLVVTNKHITALTTGPVRVKSAGKWYDAVEVFEHPSEKADLAVIVVKGSLPVAVVAESEPPEGAKVTLLGYDARGQGKLSEKTGKVVRGDADGRFYSTLEPYSGDSGGGVFWEGALVCVNSGFFGSYEARGPQMGAKVATVRVFVRAKVSPRFPRLAERLEGRRGLLGRLFGRAADRRAEWVEVEAGPPKAEGKKSLWLYRGGIYSIPEGSRPEEFGLPGAAPYTHSPAAPPATPPAAPPMFYAPQWAPSCPNGQCAPAPSRRWR